MTTRQHQPHRPVILALRQYPQRGHTTSQHQPHRPVILASRQYPQGGVTTRQHQPHRPVILALRQYPQRGHTTSQHQPHRPVILASRQYPQGGDNKTKQPTNPLTRHCGLGPQSRGEGLGIEQDKQYPLSLTTEDQSMFQCLTLGAEGEQYDTSPHQSHGQPTMAAHVTDCTGTTHYNHPYPNQSLSINIPPSYWL